MQILMSVEWLDVYQEMDIMIIVIMNITHIIVS